MPITNVDQRMILIPDYVNRSGDRETACNGYLRHLMEKVQEPYYFESKGEQIPRVKIEYIGNVYFTINYVRDQDEYLISLLIAASKNQKRLL